MAGGTRSSADAAPHEESSGHRAPARAPLLVIPLLYVALVLAGFSVRISATTPLLLVIGVGSVAVSVWSPRAGILVALGLLMLVPQPFSILIGPISTTIGRLVLWTAIASSLARTGSRSRVPTNLDVPALLVLAAMCVSMVANLPDLAFFEVSGAIRKIALFITDFGAFFWVVGREFPDRKQSLAIVKTIVGVMGVVSVVAIIEYFTDTPIYARVASSLPDSVRGPLLEAIGQSDPTLERGLIRRVIGTMEQPLVLGIALALALPLAVGLSAGEGRKQNRLLWAGAGTLITSAIVFTGARSIYVLAVLTLCTFMLFANERRVRLGVAGIAIAVGSLFAVQPDVRNTMLVFFQPQSGPQLEGSIESRVVDYAPIARRVEDSPVYGYGPRTFAQDELVRSGRVPDVRNLVLDNAYLGHLVETGVLGLGSLLLLLGTAYVAAARAMRRHARSREKSMHIALFCVVQNWLLMGLAADVWAFNAPPRMFAAVLAVVAIHSARASRPHEATSADDSAPLSNVGPIA